MSDPVTAGAPDPEARGTGSRARILRSAVELFARRGFGSTAVRDIAEAAGVSQGLMYNYFPGKEGLLRAAIERSMEDVRASFARADTASTPRARLEALPREALAVVEQNREFWQLSYQLRMQSALVGDLAGELVALSDAIRERIEALLTEIGSDAPATEARVLFAAIDGAAQHMVLDPEHYPAGEVAREIVRRFLPPEDPRVPGGIPLAGGHP